MLETRVLIIDDVMEIHSNIRSIFDIRRNDKLEALTQDLFGESRPVHPSRERLEKLQIESAYQGEEGYRMIAEARAEGRPYAVAIVDMRMPPGWDGLQTIKKIREIEPDTEIIICSAYSDYSWYEIALELGASDKFLFLSKPFEVTEMKQMVMNLVEKWSLNQHNQRYIEELKKANTAAESSNHAKQEFLSIIGHELRTPLNVILLTIEELLEQQQDEGGLQIIRNSHRSTLRLARTIEDILNYTQLDKTDFSFPKAKFRLKDIATDLKERWSAEDVPFHIDIADAIPELLLGDRDKLTRLLNQLLSNAFKFDPNGPIDLSIHSTSSKPNSKAQTLGLHIEVRDKGIGMTSEQLRRSMELFYQADPIISGSGLGLSYAKKLVDALGGTICLESDPGLGTCVTVQIPFSKA